MRSDFRRWGSIPNLPTFCISFWFPGVALAVWEVKPFQRRAQRRRQLLRRGSQPEPNFFPALLLSLLPAEPPTSFGRGKLFSTFGWKVLKRLKCQACSGRIVLEAAFWKSRWATFQGRWAFKLSLSAFWRRCFPISTAKGYVTNSLIFLAKRPKRLFVALFPNHLFSSKGVFVSSLKGGHPF